MNLKRIRLDAYGLILQRQNGDLLRIPLPREQFNLVENQPESGLRTLSATVPALAEFLVGGKVDASLDLDSRPFPGLRKPLRIYYGIEPRCDLQCAYCGPRELSKTREVRFSVTEDFLLQQIAGAGTFQLQLTGGEIMVRGESLLDTVMKAKDHGLAVILATNGVWKCVEDRARLLRGLAEAGNVIQTKVSIEGTPATHDRLRGLGTYEQTVRTLADLANHGLNPRINTTIFKSTCTSEDLEHVVALAAKYRTGLQAIPVRPVGRASALADEMPEPRQLTPYLQRAAELRQQTGVAISFNFDIFVGSSRVAVFDLFHPVSCGAPLIGFHLTHTGEVYPCGFAQSLPDRDLMCAGVVSESTSLLSIWQKSPVLERIRSAGKSLECRECRHYGSDCWGGCWVVSHALAGDLAAKDPYCIKDLEQPAREGRHGRI
jgi:AdoMet-dependent heme synthase